MEIGAGAVPGTDSVPMGRTEVPFAKGTKEAVVASWEAIGVVTGGWDAGPEDPTLAAPTVTVTVFAEVTVIVVATPQPLTGAFPVSGELAFPTMGTSVLPPPAETSLTDLDPTMSPSLALLETGRGTTVTVLG